MKRIYPVWMIITVGLFALGVVFAGANIETFLDLPSLFIVVFPSTLMLLTCFGWDEIAEAERLRRCTRTGRPCGDARFVDTLESTLGRILSPRKRGPKPRAGPDQK